MLTSKCINVEAEDWVKLKKISQKKGIAMSVIIREAIQKYIKSQKGV